MPDTATIEKLNAPDLTKSFPRSPNALLGPYLLLPRIIDKCRAVLAGIQGEYKYNCPLDQRFFSFTGVDAEAFRAEVAAGKNDADLLAWVQGQTAHLSDDEILAWAYDTRNARPETPEKKAYVEGYSRKHCPHATRIETFFQMLDDEEGRF